MTGDVTLTPPKACPKAAYGNKAGKKFGKGNVEGEIKDKSGIRSPMVGMGAEKLEVASEGGHERKFEVALTVVCGFAETKEELDVPNPVIDVGGAGDAFTEAEIE